MREFAFGMRKEVGAVAVECKHEEGFGVEARGGDTLGGEAGDRGLEGLAEEHVECYFTTEARRHRGIRDAEALEGAAEN